jgi:hypothetical protein
MLEGQLKPPRFYKPQQAFSLNLGWRMKDDAYNVRTANKETAIARLLTHRHSLHVHARGLHEVHAGHRAASCCARNRPLPLDC